MRSNPRALLIFTALGLATAPAFASDKEENADRIVDRASVDMQDEADQELSLLAKKYRGTAREAAMLLRLAELRLEIADSLFRVAYGPNESGLKAAYKRKLAAGLAPLTRILTAYGKTPEAARALFLRGKAHKELGQDRAALADFEAFLAKHSKRDEAPLAAIGIADISIVKQNYRRAIQVLAVVIAKPSHPLYPNALSKRAWALQVNGNPAAAVADLRALAKFFQTRAQANRLSAGDASLREAVLGDVPTIAYMAFRENPRRFPLSSLNELLRSFDTGEGYRRMAIRVTDHLRTADLNTELRAWKAIVLKSDPSKKENFPMLVSILEYDLDREAYDDVTKTTVDVADILAKHPETEDAETARRLVMRAIEKLTKRLTDYRKTAKANEAERHLAVLLPAYDRMTTPADARRIAARWNLGETYFSLERYESAAIAYRWVYENWTKEAAPGLAKLGSKQTAALKAISSHYEALREAKVVPEKLEATAQTKNPMRDAAKIASVRTWIGWIDAYGQETGQRLDHFEFEADRTLYQAGFQDEAMARLKNLALAMPTSKVAVPSASLVVDTWIARKRWDQVEAQSKDFASGLSKAQPKFAKQMSTQAAAAKFKRAEIAYAAKNYGEAIKHAKEFVSDYGKTSLAIDAAGIVCNAYLASNELDSAVNCFSNFAQTYSGTPAAKQALRSAARIEDQRYHFAAAADLYTRYFNMGKLSATESLTIRKRILLLSRATGDSERMERVSSNRALCAPKLQSVCNLNQALVALQQGSKSAKTTEWALNRSRSSSKDLRAIYAMIAIGGLATDQWKSLSPTLIDRASKTLAANWTHTDPSVRYFLIARGTKAFRTIVERERDGIRRLPVEASEQTITRRMRALQAFEARTSAIAEVPVNAVRAHAMAMLFLAYGDLITDIKAIPAPSKATPAQLSEHRRLLNTLAEPFVMKSRKLRDASASLEMRERAGLDAGSIDSIWKEPMAVKSAGNDALRKEWANAVNDGNWSRVAFLSDEAGETKGVPSGWSKAARAASLAEAGAASEAKVVFGDACRDSSAAPSVRDACRSVAKKGRG
jgi:TolA-binding protein